VSVAFIRKRVDSATMLKTCTTACAAGSAIGGDSVRSTPGLRWAIPARQECTEALRQAGRCEVDG
jgi:hypothetical protein